jgi:hypothetical protein
MRDCWARLDWRSLVKVDRVRKPAGYAVRLASGLVRGCSEHCVLFPSPQAEKG